MKLMSSVPNTDTPTANQDVGVPRDDVTPGDGTGTPVREDWQADLYYGLRAILDKAGLTPDNSEEGVVTSQVADAMQYIINGVTGQRANKNTGYTILDNDFYRTIYVDTTSADVTITMPLLANNYGRRIRIIHAKSAATPFKVIIAPNGTDTNSLTNDGLAAVWLPKVGDYIEFEANDTTGALLWQSVGERVSAQLRLDTHAGYGSTDNKIEQFTNSLEDFGNMFTHNHGSYGTAGLEITIARSGKYSFTYGYSEATGSNDRHGLSLNSAELTTDVLTIIASTRLAVCYGSTAAESNVTPVSWSGYLKKNDVVRPHTLGVIPTTAEYCTFTASYLGN